MKKPIFVLIVIVTLLSGCLSYESENTAVTNSSINNAEQKKIHLQGLTFLTEVEPSLLLAKAQEKPIFVYVRSEDCGYCIKFEAEAFTNKTVISTLNDNFILVSIDVYRQQSESINFRVRGTPTEIFLDKNGIEIKRISGYLKTQPFLDTINEII